MGSPAPRPAVFFGEPVDEVVGDAALHQDAPRRHADLARVQVGAEGGRIDGVLDVGVVEHDQRVLAPELEHHPLQVPAGGLGDLAAGTGRAGEVDPPHGRVRDQLVADCRSALARCRDDVQDAGRQTGGVEDLAPQLAADPRRLLGRLQDHGVAERQRRRDRPGRQDQGGVPGRDRGDHADGAPDAHRHRTGHVGRDHLTDGQVRRAGCLAEQPRHEVELEHREAERRPGLADQRVGDLVVALVQEVRSLEEDPLALGRRRRRPGRECRRGGLDRTPCIGRTGRRSPADRLAGERVEDVERRAVRRLGPLTADEVAAL